MNPYIVTFIGNEQVSKPRLVLKTLYSELDGLFGDEGYGTVKSYPVFYCGGYGQFSQIASEAIDMLREKHPEMKSEKLFITPYLTPSYLKTLEYMKDFYDEIVYPPLENVPAKYAISRRNQWMIDRSDLLIAYMENPFGNTRKCVDYATRKNIPILHIGWGKTKTSIKEPR